VGGAQPGGGPEARADRPSDARRAWLVWQGVREHRGLAWVGAGIVALAAYGFVATLQDDANFGRIVAA
jgi:drug/metabolite transporter superfamily protein YnfA